MLETSAETLDSGFSATVTRGRLSETTVLLVASFGAFLAFLDATIVNVAFPSIQTSFAGTSISELSWILNAYNIVFAAFLIVFGRLADLVGRRRMFVAGIALFTVASAVCAAAPTVQFLVAARLFQAGGAAMLVPASLALVIAGFSAEHRAHAVGLWGASAALAAGLGPVLGGALVEVGGWRWAFLVNIPFGIAAIFSANRWLVESRAPGRRRMPDLLGAALLAGGLAMLTLTIVKGNDWGWTSPATLGVLAGSIALFAGFGVSSRRHPSPLLDVALLRIRTFAVSNYATVLAGMGFYAYMLTNILWLQYVWGYSVFLAGAALVPGAIVAAAVAAVLGPVAERYGHRWVVVPGAVVWMLAYVWYYQRVGLTPDFVGEWLPGQVLSGIGVGATLPVLGSAALGAVPEGRYATASAVISSTRQLGGVLGIAVLVVIVGSPTAGTAAAAFRGGWLFCAACFAGCAVLALALGSVRTADEGATEPMSVGAVVIEPVRSGGAEPEPIVSAGPSQEPATLFRELPARVQQRLQDLADTVVVPAGSWLLQAGEAAQSMYILRTGRMEVVIGDTVVRELAAGSVIGELALLTGGRRTAGVRARRDSTVLEVSRAHFDEVLLSDPDSLSALVKVLARRLSDARPPPLGLSARPRVITVLALHDGAPAAAVAAALVASMSPDLRVAVLRGVGADGLDRAERDNDRVVLVADHHDERWDAFCLRQADFLVLVSDTSAPPQTPPGVDHPDLVLVGRRLSPEELLRWGEVVRPWRTTQCEYGDVGPALGPVAARVCGTSLGVVLAGGGARSFGQIGVLAELAAAGLRVDRIAGCSLGSVIGSIYATGVDPYTLEQICYAEFVRRNPLGDYALPRAAVLRGHRLDAALHRRFHATVPIEALPRQFRCVSTDLLTRSRVVHSRGSLIHAVRASSRLPVLLPPVRTPDQLLVDGSILDNLPVDLLTERDEGPVIAVNVSMGGSQAPPQAPTQNSTTRAPRTPRLGETLLRTMMINTAGTATAARDAGAYVITPATLGVGLLEFHQFDRLVAAGRTAARMLLERTGGDLSDPERTYEEG
ncbi:MAG TPA: DHA2 family efflux MFS transporter permease subunit [Candidatus Nanopelagicales bacterium]